MKWWNWWYLVIIAAVVILVLAYVEYGHTQTATPQQAADVQQLISQIQKVGCQAEENAAAQTILQLRKENDDLKAKLTKSDPPPKSGATKH